MSSGDHFATNDLYMTIKAGSASPEKVRMLVPGFEILEELGRGAFGVVYRARDEKLDRQVAIKIPLIDDLSLCQQYIKEAKNAAKLEYPGIVPVYQVGTLENGQPFVVQRLIEGTTLRKFLSEMGQVALLRACKLMAEVAGAVGKAHEVGMIHRDLKPDNILLDSQGKPWVADFGLAILEDEQQHHRGERAGTPLYMSPEQLQGRADWLDGRADIYALGVMLYELLVGRPPFEAKTLKELEEQVFYRDARPLCQRLPNLPSEMDDIFQNCCAKKVTDRYDSAHELAKDLLTIAEEYANADTVVGIANEGVGPSPPTRRTAIITRRTTQKRLSLSSRRTPGKDSEQDEVAPKNWTRTIVAAAAAIALGLLGLFMFIRPDRDPPQQPPEAKSEPSTITVPPTTVTEQTPKIPQRPFRVAITGGTHTSIQAALNDSQEGDTIRIAPGNYTESLVITKKIKLQGDGSPDDTFLIGTKEPAITVQAGASVSIEKLAIDSKPPLGTDINTIEVSGELDMIDCKVTTRSFDGIKARFGAVVSIRESEFQSTRHPAIHATETKGLNIVDCTFTIRPPSKEEVPVGIQASKCGGTMNNCKFHGSGAAIGIQWKEAAASVLIENCDINGCENGAIFQNCADVTLKTAGPATARSKLEGCQNGLLFENSKATVSRFNIVDSEGATGIRIVGNVSSGTLPADENRVVILSDCEIVGYGLGLSVEKANTTAEVIQVSDARSKGVQVVNGSRLDMKTSIIEKGEFIGLYVEDSVADLKTCEIKSNLLAGVLVYGKENALRLTQVTKISENYTGLVVCAGNVHLDEVDFQANSQGIVVSSIEKVLKDAESKIVAHKIDLNLQGVSILNNKIGAINILVPCAYKLSECLIDDPKNRNLPKLGKGLVEQREGDKTIVRDTNSASPST